MHLAQRFAVAVAMVFALALPTNAQENAPPPEPQPKAASAPQEKPEEKPASPTPEAVIAFGVSHPDCQQWSDGCVICKRGADVVACSTPGIACQPVEPVCKDPAK